MPMTAVKEAPDRPVVIGRYGKVTPDRARRLAQYILGKVAGGDNPGGERAKSRAMSTLGEAFEDYMKANPNRSIRNNELYSCCIETRAKLGGGQPSGQHCRIAMVLQKHCRVREFRAAPMKKGLASNGRNTE